MSWTGPTVAVDETAVRLDGPVLQKLSAHGLQVKGVAKRFGETHALVDASLSVVPGEVHAIVGENGSGKSTLAKILAGVVLPDAGAVHVFGSTPRTPGEAIAAGVATIFQEVLVADDLTVTENVFAGRDRFWRRCLPEGEKRRQTAEIMSRLVGSPVDPNARVKEFPLAIKQWIVIARAILSKPRVLIFDESSAALDLAATQRLHVEMSQLKAAGCAIILVTHRIAELIRIADTATVLRDGMTVGRLGKSQITEERILELMSAEAAGAVVRPAAVVSAKGDPALSARAIRIRTGGKPFDFEVRRGEIVGLTGLDGAGQTEFARLLAGVDPCVEGVLTAGTAQVGDLAMAEAAGIAYVSGDRKREGIFPRLSILENFAIALMKRQAKLGVIDTRARARSFASGTRLFSLKFGRESDRITTLSGGNQQKVLIARALATTPKVIVLNDPARGVDIATKQELWRHLRAFADDGGAVVYLSTEIEEFPGFADRVDVFVDGHVSTSLSGRRINEQSILSALFGRSGAVNFDEAASA